MRLSRAAVLARAKAVALDGVRRLNCWGSHLTDERDARVRGMDPSWKAALNGISDLEPLNQCQNLSELYLRKNNIASLNELFYLKNLPRLRVLWLSENPCCGSDPHRYRMTVLRNLPSLQKLDNQAVTEEELSQAMVDGEEITAPPARRSMENGCSASTESSAAESTMETESELLSFGLEETNKIREQLGMKPVPRDKFSSFSPQETDCSQNTRVSIFRDQVAFHLQDAEQCFYFPPHAGCRAVFLFSSACRESLMRSVLSICLPTGTCVPVLGLC
uniref:Cilia- and flagella-associated protein 410 n=1 Tax=Chrysolophus pictus TaxID=9089 RepID=A0A8C3M401_CHRPC